VPRERITACLIVQNEHDRLPDALQSVAFCDETVVVDGGSTDDTVQIARSHGAHVIESPWPGFAKQRNVAIDAASTDWILEIDADERISTQLRQSILAMLADPPGETAIVGFPLRNHFLGRPLGPSAKYPAFRTRLFRRGAYRHDEQREVHEGLYPRERPLALEGDLEHELASTLGEALSDLKRYARLESRHIGAAPPQSYLKGILLRPLTKLVYRTLIDGGWRDGWRGMLKVGLDATSDSLVWLLALTQRRPGSAAPDRPPSTGQPVRGHFGHGSKGPVKVVAIAPSGRLASTASQWLAALREHGVDVALVTDDAHPPQGMPVRPVERIAPLAVLRALQVEGDLRTIDAVISVGRRARLVQRLVPPPLRPAIEGLSIDIDPRLAAQIASEAIGER
jgi:hypothetical protein